MEIASKEQQRQQWQNTLRARLMERAKEGEQYREIIEQYKRLARTTRELKIRNKALLKSGTGPSTGTGGLVTHLETELSSLRTELSHLYRSQAAAQNKQLSLSDALRDRDEEVRGLREELRTLREFQEAALKREREWEGRYESRGRDLETLNDELLSLNLELTSTLTRNAALKSDNAQLVQRWIDKMQENVDSMNVAFDAEQRGHEQRREDRVDGEWEAVSTGAETAPASEAGGGADRGNGAGDVDGVDGAGEVGDALADAAEDAVEDTGSSKNLKRGEEEGLFGDGPADEPTGTRDTVDMSASTFLPPKTRSTPRTAFSGPTASKGVNPNSSSNAATKSGVSVGRTSSQGPGPFAFAQRSTSASTSSNIEHSKIGSPPPTAGGPTSRSSVNARRKMFEKPAGGSEGTGGVKQQQQDFRAGGKA